MYRLTSGSPTMTVQDVADRAWLTIIGCGIVEHAVRFTGPELLAKFPPHATLGQIAERLVCSHCGSKSGEIGFVQGAGVGKAGPDGRTSLGLARNDTLELNKKWREVAKPQRRR